MANTRGQDNDLNQDADMDDEEVISNILPEEVVEEIIAMMPFPSVLKAGVLSKSWQARLSPLSSLNDEESKRLATGFQKQLLGADWSNNLGTFYPVCTTEKDLIGYDQASRKWRTLPPLSFTFSDNSRLHLVGSVLYEIACRTCRCVEEQQRVEDILTPERKQLLQLLDDDHSYVTCVKLFSGTPSETYKIFMFCKSEDCCPDHLGIYHSKSETGSSILRWNFRTILRIRSCQCERLNFTSIAFLDGVLYMLRGDSDTGFDTFWEFLWSFHVEDEHVEELTLSCDKEIDTDLFEVDNVRLAACNGNLVMVLMKSSCHTIHVFQIDLQLRRSWEVARCAPAAFRLDTSNVPMSEVTCIFYEMGDMEDSEGLMLVYNQHKDEWSFFSFPRTPYRWSAISFQPSLICGSCTAI